MDDADSAGSTGSAGGTTGASTHPDDRLDRPGEGGPETALVTDCDGPVGRATALAFREEGWRVYAVAPGEAALEGLEGRGCLTDELDLADDRNVRRVVKRVTREAGRVDCLVTATRPGHFGPVEEVPVADVRAGFEDGVLGPYRLIQRVLPHMRERGDGTVVAITSVIGRLAPPGTGPDSAAAAATRAVADALRAEVAEFGVDVVLVEPALVDAGTLAASGADGAEGAAGRGAGEAGRTAGRDPDADGEPRLGEDDPTEYAWVHELIADVCALADGGPGAVPPERVGAVVVNAASATMPAPRYPVGTLADLLSKARYLPDDWRDLLFRLAVKTA